MFNLAVPAWELVIRSITIYVALFAALRLFGKREVGQFTLFDLILVLLVANAVQPAMTGPDSSLAGGVVIIASLVVFNFLVGRLSRQRWFDRFLSPQATIIIRDGHYDKARLDREGVTEEEVGTAIREHGLENVSDVRLGVLEPDGSISIVPTDARVTRTKRRVRYRRTI
jgi:uncharacterized membrane protein YcaP (DUF421 family)